MKRTVGDGVDVLRDHLQGRARHARRRGARSGGRASAAGARSRCARSATTAGAAGSSVDRPGRWQFAVAAWTDRVATWQDEIRRKSEAGQTDLAGELSEGAVLLGRETLTVADGARRRAGDRHGETRARRPTRSTSIASSRASAPGTSSSRARSAASAGVAKALPQLAELGFDVVYLPPIHPIGLSNRKGRNNTLTAEPGDVGSPWAIGAKEGGHDAINPELGTWDDFDAMVAAAKEAGVEIALDFAIQCSPDHPWLKEHPEWFNRRPDGTLKYAENPPKKLPGHLQRQLRVGGLAGPLAGAAATSCSRWVEARRHRLPRRQPAHEAGAVLGVADPRGAARRTRR